MKNRVFRNWNLVRLIRLSLGLLVIGQGWYTADGLVIIFGSLLTVTALLLPSGCCAGTSCYVPVRKKDRPGKANPQETYTS